MLELMKKFSQQELNDAWAQIQGQIEQARLDADRAAARLCALYPGTRAFSARLPSYAPQRYSAGPAYLPQYIIEVQLSQYDSVHPDLQKLADANQDQPPIGIGRIDNTKGFYWEPQGKTGEIYWVDFAYYDAHYAG